MTTNIARREDEIVAAVSDLSNMDRGPVGEARYMDRLARRSVALSSAEAAAVMLVGEDGKPVRVAATSEAAQLPLDVSDNDLRLAANDAGFPAMRIIPLRQGVETLGALVLFGRRPERFADDLVIPRAIAALAANVLVEHRALLGAERLARQLQTALRSRIMIEQAKGILAERHGLALGSAFEMMRRFARHDRIRLDHVAKAIIENSPMVAEIAMPFQTGPRERSG
ncbi:GAF and ANTAR domain-containing protein [Actinophytocola sp.]|uniref:GAF and ANTAR domain-containing protein n=1 Tax=Actinophytocola sp. TaxID=1872138 RepID=UPI002D4EC05F|nr:GAF and ANTAR domain-containing protein [Actinophytocola sp.]HYQ68672.1 GAF and ANTAR domain-containing protein [Actinophytocola sp.]